MKEEICPFTMDEIKIRCSSCEPGECWDWRGAFVHGGRRPVLSKRVETEAGKVRKQFYARHISLWLARGHRTTLGLLKAVITTCDNDCCVNPDHLRVVSRATVVRNTAAKGLYSTPAHRRKIAQGKRAISKLTDDAVREIRDSDSPAKDEAAKRGVSAAYIYMLRRGEFRKDYSSPFAGLGS